VKTGSRTETSVQILSGLAAGDILITSGLQQLRPGLPVLASARETRL
jgi:membrane fusion protein (multidrug efflux system)